MLLFLMLMRYAFARIHNTQFFFFPQRKFLNPTTFLSPSISRLSQTQLDF